MYLFYLYLSSIHEINVSYCCLFPGRPSKFPTCLIIWFVLIVEHGWFWQCDGSYQMEWKCNQQSMDILENWHLMGMFLFFQISLSPFFMRPACKQLFLNYRKCDKHLFAVRVRENLSMVWILSSIFMLVEFENAMSQ